jgi:DNA-directed RNA polymerase subunit RPC12/RpoP
MANVRTCADCTTQYALDLAACPHCGSSTFVTEEGITVKRLPLFVTISCAECGRGPWTVRLTSVTSGLIDLPTLACASCGSRVPVTWPPEEEPMSPKITAHGGATNAREEDVSPVSDASQPQDVAEDVLGRPTSDEPEPVQDEASVEDEEAGVDYEGMTLAELREAAGNRDLPTYGTKAQLTERLHEADAAESSDAEDAAE